jgi:hypothetical protein
MLYFLRRCFLFSITALVNIEWAIKNEQSRETGIIGYTRRGKTKHGHNTICVGHQYMQANRNKDMNPPINNWR